MNFFAASPFALFPPPSFSVFSFYILGWRLSGSVFIYSISFFFYKEKMVSFFFFFLK